MHIAENKTNGELLSASDARAAGYARQFKLICPCCKEPVLHKRGNIISPYFAHRTGRHDPNCENYHPGIGGQYTPHPRVKSPHLVLDKDFLEAPQTDIPMLYAERIDNKALQLSIKLPDSRPHGEWSGQLSVIGKRGERICRYVNLRDASLRIPITPEAGKSYVRKIGDVSDGYWNVIAEHLPILRDRNNVFRCSLRHSKILPERGALYWGERYWMILRADRRHQRSEPAFLGIQVLEVSDDWIGLEFELPNPDTLSDFQKQDICSWLERSIFDTPPKAFLKKPFPFAIDNDGAFLIPFEEVPLLIGVTGGGVISAYDEENVELEVEYKDDGYWLVHHHETSCVQILLDGYLAISIKVVNEFRLFSPRGIRISVDGQEVSLIESNVLKKFSFDQIQKAEIEVDNRALINCIQVNGSEWDGATSISSFFTTGKRIFLDANGLGQFLFVSDDLQANFECPELPIEKIHFLLNVASRSRFGVEFPFKTSSLLANNQLVSKLLQCRWDRKYLPQVYAVANELRRRSEV